MWRLIPLGLVVALALFFAFADDCGNELIARSDAPDGSRSAVMFERNCGATTGFSTQISIVDPGEHPSGAGDVFRAEDVRADMKWLAPDHLLIEHTQASDIYEQDDEVSGVRISYRTIAR